MGTTWFASNADELLSVAEKAKGGDEIRLAGGDYGEVSFIRTEFDSEVRIVSDNADDPAVFEELSVWEAQNITFDSIEVRFVADEETKTFTPVVSIANSSDIKVLNSIIEGDTPVNGDDPDIDPLDRTQNGIEGRPIGVGLSSKWSENVVVEGTEIFGTHRGAVFAATENVEFNDNHVHHLRSTPLSGRSVQNFEASGNHFHSSDPWKLGGSGDHGNFVHLWTMPDQDRPSENVIFRDNFFEQGSVSDDAIMGIYIDDNGNDVGYKNVVIANNLIHNGNQTGILTENVDGMLIESNTLVNTTDSSKPPTIRLVDDTKNVVIDNNIVNTVLFREDVDPVKNNVQVLDNFKVQSDDPAGAGYQGDIFVNGLTRDGNPKDFSVIPGSKADGYGAELDLFEHGDTHVVYVSANNGSGMRLNRVKLELEEIQTEQGELDLTNAEIEWTFPDGVTKTGETVAHRFQEAGQQDVGVKITLDTGEVINATKSVSVIDPFALKVGFNKGFGDRSSNVNEYETSGSVTTETDVFGRALRLKDDDARVSYEANDEIVGNSEYTMSLAFKKDGASEDVDGRIVYFAGSSHITTKDDNVTVKLSTTGGDQVSLSVNDASITDGQWHHLAFSFSAKSGEARLYLNGDLVDNASGLTGVQQNIGSHDLHLGGLFGGSFGGLIDRIKFVRAETSAERIERQADRVKDANDDVVQDTTTSNAVVDDVVAGQVLSAYFSSSSEEDNWSAQSSLLAQDETAVTPWVDDSFDTFGYV